MTGQFRLRAVTARIVVIGVSGNAAQRRKTMRRWKKLGYDPVRFYMNAAQVPNAKVSEGENER